MSVFFRINFRTSIAKGSSLVMMSTKKIAPNFTVHQNLKSVTHSNYALNDLWIGMTKILPQT
ncbi:hypothetical protein HMPREF0645_2549 [Hallella bergensis DSM 17361]|uniref:Peptidase C30 domain-containing protein n=1 Tax=Hallella bergensis DSM 17361 TaxID=585502 RepID=D1Q014_9BACT|nr:hypothetical protein HMPREF0645_2549 [Hallella bergensis DSM 17361]